MSKTVQSLHHVLQGGVYPPKHVVNLLVAAVQVFPVDDAFVVENPVTQLPDFCQFGFSVFTVMQAFWQVGKYAFDTCGQKIGALLVMAFLALLIFDLALDTSVCAHDVIWKFGQSYQSSQPLRLLNS